MQGTLQLSPSAAMEPYFGKTFFPRRRAGRQEDREDSELGFIHLGAHFLCLLCVPGPVPGAADRKMIKAYFLSSGTFSVLRG